MLTLRLIACVLVEACLVEATTLDDTTVNAGSAEVPQETPVLLQRNVYLSKPSHASPTAAGVQRCMSYFYGLAPRASYPNSWVENPYEVECTGDDACALLIPNTTTEDDPPLWVGVASASVRSNFTFGRKPVVVAGRVRRRLRLGVARQEYNPSLARLPTHIATAFPSGRWLATVRARKKRIPHAVTYVAVLDADFEPLAYSIIDVPDGELAVGVARFKAYVGDARLLLLKNGTMLVSFMAYSVGEHYQMFAPLHIQATASGELHSWLSHAEIRELADCPSSEPAKYRKNVGFFEIGQSGDVGALDWIHPTTVASLDALTAQPTNASFRGFRTICMNATWISPELDAVPWAGAIKQTRKRIAQGRLSGSTNPIWIEELQEYVGLGHIVRGYGSWDGKYGCDPNATMLGGVSNHHYTFVFYSLQGHKPFSLRRMSPEFCIASGKFDEDCDALQFVSSVHRDGDELVVAYGVMDMEAHFMTVSVDSVIEKLRTIGREAI